MSDKMCTVRLPAITDWGETGKAYWIEYEDGKIFLPKSLTEITKHKKHIDFDCPKWLAIQKGLKEEIVSEY